jgi:hypothetical protein
MEIHVNNIRVIEGACGVPSMPAISFLVFEIWRAVYLHCVVITSLGMIKGSGGIGSVWTFEVFLEVINILLALHLTVDVDSQRRDLSNIPG